MKTSSNFAVRRLMRRFLLAFIIVFFAAPPVRAGLTFDLRLIRENQGGSYHFYPEISANATPPAAPLGVYLFASPQQPVDGTWRQLELTAEGFNFMDGGSSVYNNFASVMDQITNGNWTITFTNATTTNHFEFAVSVVNVTSNQPPALVVTLPVEDEVLTNLQPTFTWVWANNWGVHADAFVFNNSHSLFEYANLPAGQNYWPMSTPLSSGENVHFQLRYETNSPTDFFIATTPLDTISAQPVSGWISTAALLSSADVDFSVSPPIPPSAGGGHTNLAHYTFDDTSNNLFELGRDESPNDNDLSGYSNWGKVHTNSTEARAGAGAVQFFGFSGINANGKVLTNLNTVLAGSFSFSAWVKTTASRGNDYDNAILGDAIFWAYNDHGNTNDTIPLAITGSKAAFTTRGESSGVSDTLHSLTSVNDGDYHLITVTRNQVTGEKKIYVDGSFENSEIGTTNSLNGNDYYLNVGGTANSSYIGILDDLQIYSGVLSSNEVQELYGHPGMAIEDVEDNAGVGEAVVHYDFDEGTPLAVDVSGNTNDIVYAGDFGGSGPSSDVNSIAGSGSVHLDGGSFLTAPTNLLPSLARSFTVSIWINTEQDFVNSKNNLDAAGIVAADVPGGDHNDLMPVGLNESGHIVFNTGDENDGDHEMYSSATVNDGSWHHIVVTRNQTTGEKNIYIDGLLDGNSPEFGSTNLLNEPRLLTIGALADASISEPFEPETSGDNGYDGLLDDIQIYPRVMKAGEVAYLYNNPGTEITNTVTPPVDVRFQISITREQTLTYGDIYSCFPGLNSVNITEVTQHRVESPNGLFGGTLTGGGSTTQFSLDSLLNECTNGLWHLYINEGDISEQVFTFSMQITGLDTNLLKAVAISSPANNSISVPTSPAFTWTGPVGFNGIFVQTYRPTPPNNYVSTNLPGTSMSWPTPPTLQPGTNRFYLSYHTNDVPFITTSTPLSGSSNPINSWTSTGHVNSDATVEFVVATGTPPVPVTMLNPQKSGTNFVFSLLTQSNLTHRVESRTNLTLGSWIEITNFVGNGAIQQVILPIGTNRETYYRIGTQ